MVVLGREVVEQAKAALIDRATPQKAKKSPECGVLAANNYKMAVAMYGAAQNHLYLPYMSELVTSKPIIMQLYGEHFYLVSMKPRSRVKWPKAVSGYEELCARFHLVNNMDVFF